MTGEIKKNFEFVGKQFFSLLSDCIASAIAIV